MRLQNDLGVNLAGWLALTLLDETGRDCVANRSRIWIERHNPPGRYS
jgi:hypothetical protein